MAWDFKMVYAEPESLSPWVLHILLITLKSWSLSLTQREIYIGGRTRPDHVLTLGLGVKPFPKPESLTKDAGSE